jgi:hypothetical protein
MEFPLLQTTLGGGKLHYCGGGQNFYLKTHGMKIMMKNLHIRVEKRHSWNQ